MWESQEAAGRSPWLASEPHPLPKQVKQAPLPLSPRPPHLHTLRVSPVSWPGSRGVLLEPGLLHFLTFYTHRGRWARPSLLAEQHNAFPYLDSSQIVSGPENKGPQHRHVKSTCSYHLCFVFDPPRAEGILTSAAIRSQMKIGVWQVTFLLHLLRCLGCGGGARGRTLRAGVLCARIWTFPSCIFVSIPVRSG